MDDFYQIIGKNIEKYRKLKRISAEELGRRVGLTKKTIRRYETGEIRIINDRVIAIADALGIDPALLYEGTDIVEPVEELTKLPIVGAVSCGNGVLAYQEIEGYEEVPTSWLNGGEYFFVRARGDSMINARIMDGDLLLIRRQEDVESGEIAAVLIDDEIVLKRVYKTNGTIILQSENPKYQPIVLQKSDMKNVRIIGKLKKVVLNF
ncbi:transcriptional repressor LexA [Anoxybacteroides amylolyticum]|uniref:Repressor LexA n=1 Tax=Anoxybacteroides amylolyticum TaxID=294699 RepID=A0A160F6H9_9BACL|nr:transcriptional repressor LexA [Anoxybacillus amylolyticus]ANB62126.1 repressor LexA [Anoxybacillus amylolyticus]